MVFYIQVCSNSRWEQQERIGVFFGNRKFLETGVF